MDEMKSFQVCYEGELDIELVGALGGLDAEPTFDNTWQLHLPCRRHSLVILRYLRRFVPPDGRLFVGRDHHARNRDFLLVRHSGGPEFDSFRLQVALGAFGEPIDIGFEATYVVRADTHQDVQRIGEVLSEVSDGESLMVTGLSYDFAFWTAAGGQMMVPSVRDGNSLRRF